MISLRIGGVTPFTTVDYPGRLAAVVFCQGCGWRCGYCHNPHLLPRRGRTAVTWADVESLLARRRGLLDAVVFSGGEPTLQPALVDAARRTRALGFRVALHTAGPDPERLARLLPWLDWVALDVKAPFDDYARVTGVPGSGRRARESVARVVRWGGDYECRTTVHSRHWTGDALLELAVELAELGVERYAVQPFRAVGCADEELRAAADAAFPPAHVRERIAALFASFTLR